jgi:RNA polymerase primary sigma factor
MSAYGLDEEDRELEPDFIADESYGAEDSDIPPRWNWRTQFFDPPSPEREYFPGTGGEGSRETVLEHYLRKASKYNLISREEEILLTRRAKTGDVSASTKLVLANLRLVIKFAKRYRNRGLDFEDLVQEGNLGLIRATQLFDPERGTRFSTYASLWIIQFISRAVDNKSRSIRLPVCLHQEIRTLRQLSTSIEQKRGAKPSTEELAKLTELSVARVKNALIAMESTISLDQKISAQSDMDLGEQITGETSNDVEFYAEMQLSRQWVKKLLKSLNENELNVVSLRYGLDGSDGLAFPQICAQTGLSPTEVRRLHTVALKKLRRRVDALGSNVLVENERRGLYAL